MLGANESGQRIYGQGGGPVVHDRSPAVVQWGDRTIRYVKGTSREAGKQPFYWQQH